MSSNNTSSQNGNQNSSQNGNPASNDYSSGGQNGSPAHQGPPQTNGHIPTFADMPRTTQALEAWRRDAYQSGSDRGRQRESLRDARN